MRRTAPLAWHLLVAALVTWPLARDPRGVLLGNPAADVWNHAWGPWWWWSALAQGRLPWRTDLLRWPEGGVLWFADPLGALIAAPLVPALGTAGAYNAMVLLSVLATSLAAAKLARTLSGGACDALGEAVASAALAGSAWIVAALHNGVTESLHLAPLALTLAWGEEAARAPDRHRWLRAGVALGLCAWASPYLGLAGGVALTVRVLAQRGPGWSQALWGAASAGLTALPAAALWRASVLAPDAIIRRPESMDEALALHNATDPRVFVAPLGFQSVDLSAEGFWQSAYLGLAALALVAWGRGGPVARAWGLAGLSAVVLALGPWLTVGGQPLTLWGARVPLPWRAVQLLLPDLALTHPLRLAAPALVLVAAYAGRAAAQLSRRPWAVALPLLVLADGLLFSRAPWPLATAEAHVPAVYDALPRDPSAREAVLDLPTDAGLTMATSRYLYWQTSHRQPIPYAPDARASTAALLDDPFFRALAGLSHRRADEGARLGLTGAATGWERLRDRGVRWIVLHRDLDPTAAPALERLLTQALGPARVVGAAAWWDLRQTSGPAPARPR